jgi:hypothetical protein
VLHHISAQVVAHGVGVPIGGIEQPLHSVWSALADVLGQLPAVLAFNRREQALQISQRPLALL